MTTYDEIKEENLAMKRASLMLGSKFYKKWFKKETITAGEDNQMAKVYLGGTWNGALWRKDIIRMLDTRKVGYFDPIVKVWNEEAQKAEIKARETYEWVLYWITPEIKGVYSIAEAVDDSNKRPNNVLFGFEVVSCTDPWLKLDIELVKSLTAVGRMIECNGGRWFRQLFEVAEFLNKQ